MRSPAWVFWLYLCSTLPWAACLVVYASRRPWRDPDRLVRRTARAMLTLYVVLTAVLAYATVVRFFHLPYTALVVLAFVFIGGVGLAGLMQLINILRLLEESRRDY